MSCNLLNFLSLLAKGSTLLSYQIALSMMLVKWLISLLKEADGKPLFPPHPFLPSFLEVSACTMEAIAVVELHRQLCAESRLLAWLAFQAFVLQSTTLLVRKGKTVKRLCQCCCWVFTMFLLGLSTTRVGGPGRNALNKNSLQKQKTVIMRLKQHRISDDTLFCTCVDWMRPSKSQYLTDFTWNAGDEISVCISKSSYKLKEVCTE